MATYSTADIWHFGHGQMLPLLVSPRRALSHRTWKYDPGDAEDVKLLAKCEIVWMVGQCHLYPVLMHVAGKLIFP